MGTLPVNDSCLDGTTEDENWLASSRRILRCAHFALLAPNTPNSEAQSALLAPRVRNRTNFRENGSCPDGTKLAAFHVLASCREPVPVRLFGSWL